MKSYKHFKVLNIKNCFGLHVHLPRSLLSKATQYAGEVSIRLTHILLSPIYGGSSILKHLVSPDTQ